jgi:hypothetical protein
MALAPSPATTRQATENERENARFMWFKNSSGLSQIARACGSEPRFLIYLLRRSLRRIPAGKWLKGKTRHDQKTFSGLEGIIGMGCPTVNGTRGSKQHPELKIHRLIVRLRQPESREALASQAQLSTQASSARVDS